MLVVVAGGELVFSGKGVVALPLYSDHMADLVGQQAQLVRPELVLGWAEQAGYMAEVVAQVTTIMQVVLVDVVQFELFIPVLRAHSRQLIPGICNEPLY